MVRKKTPPAYGDSFGPMIVACHRNIFSPSGPAEQEDGGSLLRSVNSLLMRFKAIVKGVCGI